MCTSFTVSGEGTASVPIARLRRKEGNQVQVQEFFIKSLTQLKLLLQACAAFCVSTQHFRTAPRARHPKARRLGLLVHVCSSAGYIAFLPLQEVLLRAVGSVSKNPAYYGIHLWLTYNFESKESTVSRLRLDVRKGEMRTSDLIFNNPCAPHGDHTAEMESTSSCRT